MKILITGVSKGLGKSLAEEFISKGNYVWGVARRELENPGFFYSRCDVSNVDEIKVTVSEMLKQNFIPDIIILNAGYSVDDISDKFDYPKFKENFDVNLFGNINLINAFLPFYLERKKGIFVAISSLSAYKENHKNRIGYSASKLALSKSFENLRLQYYSSGVKFVVCNAGRMQSGKSFIGITYKDAAKLLTNKLIKEKTPDVINFPPLQYFLTKILRLIPDKIFHKYILR